MRTMSLRSPIVKTLIVVLSAITAACGDTTRNIRTNAPDANAPDANAPDAAGHPDAGGPNDDAGVPETGRVSLFITDSVSDEYDHVWVTLHAVDLLTRTGSVSLYATLANATPVVIDLKSLGGPSQRFLFVATSSVPGGEYTGVRVVVGKDVMLMPIGSPAGEAAEFEAPDADLKIMVRGFDAPRIFGGGDSLLVDFDLANWIHYEGTVYASGGNYLRIADPSNVTVLSNHEAGDHEGTITQLAVAPPNQTFVLQRGTSQIPVQVGADTALYHEHGFQSAAIADGVLVEVTGIFDPTLGVLLAEEIKIEDDDIPDAEVRGTVTATESETATFRVLEEVEAFVPSSTEITVRSVAGTVFLSRRGVPMWDYWEWIELLGAAGELEAEGDWDPTENMLTPYRVKLIGPAVDEKYNELEGVVSNIDPIALSFTVAAEEWWGLNVASNEPITADLTDVYYYRTDRWFGEEVDAQEFFLSLTGGQRVELEGRFDPLTRTFRARWASFEPEEQDEDDYGYDDDGAVPIDDPTGP
jgi:hypothetical protein